MYYTCEEIAKKFNVRKETVWLWIRKGKLGAVKLGKHYRVSEEDLRDFLADRHTQPIIDPDGQRLGRRG